MRVLRWVFQLAVLAIVVLIVGVLIGNVRSNSERLGIPTGYDYLDNPANFPIADSDFRPTQPIKDALVVGLQNTLKVSIIGIVLATLLGTVVGVARLSRNWLVATAARVYVEVLRNIPLLLIIVFSWTGLALATFPQINSAWTPLDLVVISNRGVALPSLDGAGLLALIVVLAVAGAAGWAIARWRRAVSERTGKPGRPGLWVGAGILVVLAVAWIVLGLSVDVPALDGRQFSGGVRISPEFFAVLFALTIYTASHIAEIVRGSIQAVHRGQAEAADSLALSGFQRLWYVVLPQAFRIALPPLGNQYLNLAKNSTLGAVVSYYELAQVTQIAVGNGAPAVPSYLLTLGIFLVLSLIISLAINLINRRLALVER